MSMIDKLTVVCAAALALGACDLPRVNAATSVDDTAAPAAEVSELGGDAWCDELEPGMGSSTDCALRIDDQRFVYFDYLTDENGYASELIVSQQSFAGDVLATSEPMEVEPGYAGPSLRDLDGDGVTEFLIPLYSGNVNTVFAVWRQGADGIFAPAGDVSSYSAESLELRDGLIIAPSRGSATTHYEAASRFGPDGLEPVYELEIDYEHQTCTLTNASGLGSAGLDADTLIANCQARDW
tara:strand:- start:1215 stop:1931 length:717 start_codon:yes stop_codon:yes gene_type:complete